jgi:hypothetical protein
MRKRAALPSEVFVQGPGTHTREKERQKNNAEGAEHVGLPG